MGRSKASTSVMIEKLRDRVDNRIPTYIHIHKDVTLKKPTCLNDVPINLFSIHLHLTASQQIENHPIEIVLLVGNDGPFEAVQAFGCPQRVESSIKSLFEVVPEIVENLTRFNRDVRPNVAIERSGLWRGFCQSV